MNEEEVTTLLDRIGSHVVVGPPDTAGVVARGRRRLRLHRATRLGGVAAAVCLVTVGGLSARASLGSNPTVVGPATASVGPTTQGLDGATEHRLWLLAVREADGDAGKIKVAEAVKSTHARAVRVTSGDLVSGNEPVWVVQVEGYRPFVCTSCSHPYGAPAPQGRFQTVIVDATTFALTDTGMGSKGADLARLGTVVHLHS